MTKRTSNEAEPFIFAGKQVATIPVKISYRIIELFSEGLYTSPTKAIEELISNSFDAGAENVNVILSPDLTDPGAIIAVIDDGESMDAEGLRQHWLIGASNKRDLKTTPRGRAPIGKFGIGKLATFVLARHLTHICKRGRKYFAATMNYSEIPGGRKGGVEFEGEEVLLPLRELTAAEVRQCLPSILLGEKPGFTAIPLFGSAAPRSWTIAILSELK
jgi:hypothetical protein